MDSGSSLDTAEISLQEMREKLKKPSFHIEKRPDEIIVFRFDNLTRAVLVQWVDYMNAYCETWTSPLRLLYDFRGSGAPSRFFIDRVPKVFETLVFPEDVRHACLFDDGLMAHFTRSALQKIPNTVGKMEEFMNLDPAIRWLKGQED